MSSMVSPLPMRMPKFLLRDSGPKQVPKVSPTPDSPLSVVGLPPNTCQHTCGIMAHNRSKVSAFAATTNMCGVVVLQVPKVLPTPDRPLSVVGLPPSTCQHTCGITTHNRSKASAFAATTNMCGVVVLQVPKVLPTPDRPLSVVGLPPSTCQHTCGITTTSVNP
jgi:hypothetical protein